MNDRNGARRRGVNTLAYGVPVAFFTLQRRAPPSSAWTRLGCVYSLLLRPGGAAGYHERPRRPSCERQGPGVRAQLRAAVSQARPRAETAASVLSRHKQLPAFRCDTAAAGVEHAAQTPPRAAQSHERRSIHESWRRPGSPERPHQLHGARALSVAQEALQAVEPSTKPDELA